jgi:hypothetical protein
LRPGGRVLPHGRLEELAVDNPLEALVSAVAFAITFMPTERLSISVTESPPV